MAAEFGNHGSEIPGVFRKTLSHAAFHRILPININAIEDSRGMNARGKISFDKSMDAGAYKFAHMIGFSGAGKALRLAPSTKRYDHFQFGITAFQFLKLMKGAAKPVGANWIGRTIDALSIGVSMIQSCFAVGNLALIAVNTAKRIVEPGKQGCGAAGCNILDGVPAGLHAIFGKVADHLSVEKPRLHLRPLSGQS